MDPCAKFQNSKKKKKKMMQKKEEGGKGANRLY